MIWYKGINIFPSAIETVVRSFDELSDAFEIVLDQKGTVQTLTVRAEVKAQVEQSVYETLGRRLSGKLQDTECAWFAPYVELKGFECKKCGKDTMVMLTGKRKPTICPECDSKRLAKHIQEFEEMAASAA